MTLHKIKIPSERKYLSSLELLLIKHFLLSNFSCLAVVVYISRELSYFREEGNGPNDLTDFSCPV